MKISNLYMRAHKKAMKLVSFSSGLRKGTSYTGTRSKFIKRRLQIIMYYFINTLAFQIRYQFNSQSDACKLRNRVMSRN